MDSHRRTSQHYRRLILPACWMLAMLLALVPAVLPAHAQSIQGTILGTVKDTGGAVVPGAHVTLTNMDTGVVRTTMSDSAGSYQFLNVVAAHYAMRVEASGFEKWATSGVALTAMQQLRVDASLPVGNVQQTVTVSGSNASAIDTETAKISSVLTGADLMDLPTNYRASSSGTSIIGAVGALSGVQTHEGDYSIQGSLPYQTETTVDGISITDITDDSILTSTPSGDDVSEIRVAGTMTNAEFGNPGQITITSKGGTNQLHGSAWWYHQDSGLDAIDFGSVTKPHQVANTYGGRLGGPVVIPHLYNGHKKTFFFVDYEGFRFPHYVPEQYTVPTAAMKAGDFTNYSNPSAGYSGLTDPSTGASWGNVIPNTSISSIARQFLKFFPNPNHAATTNGASVPTTSYVNGETSNYYVNQDNSTTQDQVDTRGDQYFGSNQQFLLWGRYTYKKSPTVEPESLLFPSSVNLAKQNQIAVSINWTIKPDLINEFRYGLTQSSDNETNSFNGEAFTDGLGLQGLQDLSVFNGVPYIAFSNLSGFSPGRLSYPADQDTSVYNDSLTWVHGNHDFKFGGEFERYKDIGSTGFSTAEQYGNFYFSNAGNGLGEFTGVDFADFLVGIPNSTFYDEVTQNIDGAATTEAAYAQDEWQATPRLTLTYGVRWEYHPPFYDKGGYTGNFDSSVPSSGEIIYPTGAQASLSQPFLASANACDPDGVNNTNNAAANGAPCMPVVSSSSLGISKGLRKAPKGDFTPRLGFAYRLTDDSRWVLRGGYGIYYIAIRGETYHSLTATIQGDSLSYTNSVNPATGQPTYQWPQIYAGSGNAGCTTCYGQDEFDEGINVNWKDPYQQQYTLSLDHDFGAGYAGRVSYIGSVSRHLSLREDQNTLPLSSTVSAYNQPASARLFPNWGELLNFNPGGNESYDSLQIEAGHRLQNGLSFDSTFTWARAFADNQGLESTGFAGERGGDETTSILDPKVDYGRVDGTRRLLWNTTGVYALPVGRGRQFGSHMSPVLDALVGGWNASTIFTWESGAFITPYFPSGQGDPSGSGSGLNSDAAGWQAAENPQPPDRVAGVNWKPAHQNRNNWVNPSAFTCPGFSAWQPGDVCGTGAGYQMVNGVTTPISTYGPALPIGRFGNAQVGDIEGPGLINLNLGLAKTFALGERFKLRAEGSFTNVLNHTNLDEGSLDLNLSSSSFGTITSGVAARNGQVSMRLEF